MNERAKMTAKRGGGAAALILLAYALWTMLS